MELALKIAAAAVAGAICAVAIRKQSPEIALVLGLTAAALVLSWAVGLLEDAAEFLTELAELAGLPMELLIPLIKTAGIALVTHLGSSLCKDAGESGIGAALEFAGGAAAVCAALPLMRAVVETLKALM